MIKDADDLQDYFWFCGMRAGTHFVNVTTKIRKEFMLNNPRGLVTVNCGEVKEVQWTNMGGGVWKATVEINKEK